MYRYKNAKRQSAANGNVSSRADANERRARHDSHTSRLARKRSARKRPRSRGIRTESRKAATRPLAGLNSQYFGLCLRGREDRRGKKIVTPLWENKGKGMIASATSRPSVMRRRFAKCDKVRPEWLYVRARSFFLYFIQYIFTTL